MKPTASPTLDGFYMYANLLLQVVHRVNEVEEGEDQPDVAERIVGRTRYAGGMPNNVERLPALLA